MGFLGLSKDDPIAEEVENATTEKNVEENWGVIMNICDKAGKSSDEAKSYLKAIVKRLGNEDPHIGVKAVTLLDACVKNSGRKFHIELASRDFENEFMRLMNKGNPVVAKKLRESLKRWSESEFKSDGQLSLVPSLYAKLKSEGYDFTSSEPPPKKAGPQVRDPNFVESQEEEDQIVKAIELSLKESGSPRSAASSASHTSSSLYPSVNMSSSGLLNSTPTKEPRKVRALYDFEAAEDNELTFNTGEIIVVTDDSDPNWWKGSNHRGEGLFPANFVTADLNVEPEKFLYEKAKKMVQFKEEVNVVKEEPLEVEVNEEKIDRLLHLLHEADPTNPEKDTDEMLKLEREVNNMGPLIDAELERVDRKHAQLTQLSADLVEALGLYHTLMREPQFPMMGKVPYGYPSSSQQMPYMPPDMPPHMMAGPPGHQPNFPFHQVPHGYPGHPGPPPHLANPGQPGHANPGHPVHANPGQPGHPNHVAVRPHFQGPMPGPPQPHHIPQHHMVDGAQSAPHQYHQMHQMAMQMDSGAVARPHMGVPMPQQMQHPPQMRDLDQRLHEQQQQQNVGMPPFAMGPGVPNFGMPPHNMMPQQQQQPQFGPSGHMSLTQIPNGAQMQGGSGAPPHFVPSSSHITQ